MTEEAPALPPLIKPPAALHEQARRHVLEGIQRGVFPPGAKLPPDREFARQLGISPITLARGLNQLRAEGVLVRRPGRGTYVAETSDVPRPSAVAAVLFDEATEQTFHAQLFLTLHQSLRAAGMGLQFFSAEGDAKRQEAQLRDLFRNPGIAGALLWSILSPAQARRVVAARPAPFPLVFMDRRPPSPEADFVGYADYEAGLELGRGLLAEGHRRWRMIYTQVGADLSTVRERLKGMGAALAEAGHAAAALDTRAYQTELDLLDWATIVDGLPPSDAALVFMSAPEATAARDSLRRKGLSAAPRLAMFNPSGMAEDQEEFPGILEYRLPMVAMGRRAVAILAGRLADAGGLSSETRLPGRLIAAECVHA